MTDTDTAITRKNLWARTRLVVVDTETTGLRRHDRIVSISLNTVRDGKPEKSWASWINPGLAVIGAEHIHGLNAAKLAGQPCFAQEADRIRDLLRTDDRPVYLVGQNVPFDAKRLMYEYFRINEELEPVRLLDLKKLLPAAGIGSYGNDLDTFAASPTPPSTPLPATRRPHTPAPSTPSPSSSNAEWTTSSRTPRPSLTTSSTPSTTTTTSHPSTPSSTR